MSQQPMLACVVIACCASKLDKPAEARDLYTSQWFVKARAYAESLGRPWFILSAKHGLLGGHEVTAPYDETLNAKTATERRAWGLRVANELKQCRTNHEQHNAMIQHGDRVVVLAGEKYAEHLTPNLERLTGATVDRPLKGLGIGQQLQKLNELRAEVQR